MKGEALTRTHAAIEPPRTDGGIAIAPRLRDRLAILAAGRTLVIDYVASARCGAVVGDLTVGFRSVRTEAAYVQLDTVAGVPVFAASPLVELLADAGAGLELAGLPLARRVSVTLQQPELWLAFLERPGVCASKSPWARWRRA